MSVLRNLEGKLEGLVEGVFARTFKSRVEPVELARKLAKEMDENKTVSVARVYVPNEYSIYLSKEDYENFSSYERALENELSTYLIEHAREEGLALLTRPKINFETDQRLRVGEFGVQARLVKPPTEDEEEPSQGDVGRTMVYSPDREERAKLENDSRSRSKMARAFLTVDGSRWLLEGSTVTIGRSKKCDLALDDENISRRHAEVQRQGENWYVNDCGSTNGLTVNGRRVESTRLVPGDEIVIGTTSLIFELE